VSNITLNLVEAEKKAEDIAVKNHPVVFELVETMVNLYATGFNLIGNPRNKPTENTSSKNRDIGRIWLFLVTRSFHSILCSVELMRRGYYAQAMTLIRMVIEAYFLCGNCEKDDTVIDTLLNNEPNKRHRKMKIPSWRTYAKNMNALHWYHSDYVFACQFSHTSRLSLGVMTTEINPTHRRLEFVPFYDAMPFVACSKLLLRNGLLMTVFLGKMLGDLSNEDVKAWHAKARKAIQDTQQWLDGLKERYGGQ
jgi:hypothetical protein